MYEYENMSRISYGGDDDGRAVFVPVCVKCARFVKAYPKINYNCKGLKDEPNATCKKCGPTKMLFEGFM